MFLLYDAVQNSPCEITTIGSGEICSAAVLLLACGHKRLCTQNAWLMAHQSWSSVSGSQTEIQAQAEAHKKMEAKMWELLAKHSKKTAVEWKARAKEQGEIWLSPVEMVEYGVVDSVIKPTRPNPAVAKAVPKKKTNGK
jgi:ATP-dependent Clp protease protease subunit